ncbi:AAA family ATPase [Actinomyces succiniciruminis]|uniref:SMC domain protein n=1 Tax=Actinomyces succiniciruminis TaxID=1522002 RepID=A0A1L7R8N7_9ACTO|nr:ATP-binding protein [Actinomyces succiniciruminis]CED90195.1 SMC domain protein [Actinomyces succiniciruminis]
MLTRFEVTGFKNLVDVRVDFGPFTCIAGPNAVGKSNLLNAIEFLSLLSGNSFHDACLQVRPTAQRHLDVASLLSAGVLDGTANLGFAAEMILPPRAEDEFGQTVAPSCGYVRYEVEIAAQQDPTVPGGLRLRLAREQLHALDDAAGGLRFPEADACRRLIARGRSESEGRFLDYQISHGQGAVIVHREASGRPRRVLADGAQRTVLSAVASAEYPTILAARTEMSSWRFLALEPSAMRAPDDLMERRTISASGAHVPAALYRQNLAAGRDGVVLHRVCDAVAPLVDVRSLTIAEDPVRQALELRAQVGDAPELPARALSDGTLRLLTLAAIGVAEDYSGMLCLEEPENGIHPAKLPELYRLLHGLSTPAAQHLRQVVVNTHSPNLFQCAEDAEVLCAVGRKTRSGDGTRGEAVDFHPLAGTWRAQGWQGGQGMRPVPRSTVQAYLGGPAAAAD